MTDQIVKQALALWDMEDAAHRLVAARENAVYEVVMGGRRAALRLHRLGYRTDAELQSELDWMAAVATKGLSTPAPIPTSQGDLLRHIGDRQVDMLTWLDGDVLFDVLAASDSTARRCLFRQLGHDMARLHIISDTWTPPNGFVRAKWDRDGLLGEAPLWDRFWECPACGAEDTALFCAFRRQALDRLADIRPTLDYGLIHADLVPANVLVDGDTLRLIDYDDGGYGFRLFDIATALLKLRAAADYPALHDALIEGYQAVRPLDLTELNLFLALRAATYVGWNIARAAEPGATERNDRFLTDLRVQARIWMDE